MGKINSKYVALLFFFAGISLILWGTYTSYQALKSNNWPKTEGVIISNFISELNSTNRYSTNMSYCPNVEYSYQVGKKQYTGRRITFGNKRFSSRELVQNYLNQKYAPGIIVKVYYKPSSPDVSVLDPGFSLSNIIIPVFGLLFVLVGKTLNKKN